MGNSNLNFNSTSISQITSLSELEVNEDNSLEKVIEVVDEWMTDESGYDEEVYPQIEVALTQNGLSV
ncbi:MAG: hypothetical protein KME40_16675 [Komarekiella atlantica HA4396-MV6]|jgi:hypothetical protein|nr:hypothetical protein [Komarekiella atlantica HA4396-MV6]